MNVKCILMTAASLVTVAGQAGEPKTATEEVSPVRVFDSDALCSPAYFWMWNGRLETKELCRQLDEMRAQGLRNVCVHPFPKAFRPGRFQSDMTPDYLTPEYLTIFAEVTRYAAKLGMHCYLYDEGGWPSGGACGLVAKEDKDGKLAQRWLALDKDGQVQITVDRYDFKGFAPYPSIVEKGTTERFLRLTHDRYAEVLGEELGKSVRVAFTDEPNAPSGFGWTSDFAAEFKRRKGYDLTPHLADMLQRKDAPDEKVAAWSIDYRDVMADLVVERYLAPVRDWCRAHDALSGGHMNGEDNPSWTSGYGHGSILRSLRAMDVPGVDIIWRQAFPEHGGKPSVAPPFPRYAASAMHQNGGRFALSETFGIFGDSVTPRQMKWLVDYQLVRGINTFVFGYYAQTYRGQWMTLFEPHGGPVAPYWTMERPFFEYIERLCRELSCGRSGADVAVLYDVRGLWAGGRWTQEADAAQRAVAAVLDCRQVDYDFVEDRDLASATFEADGALRVGAARYRTVVLPTWRWLDAKAAARLKDFERAGGRVVRGTDATSVPSTLAVSGAGAANLRVMRRVDGKRTLYFTHNEALSTHRVSLSFPQGGTVARFDPSLDRWETVTEDGRLEMTYGPGETALYAVGSVPRARPAQSSAGAGVPVRPITGPWTLRPLVSHEVGRDDFVIKPCTNAPVPSVLGDWRATLGERFSGKAVYRTTFVAEAAGAAKLDLGEVRYAASVRLNGRDLGPRFFGPYRWDVELAAGTNVLEVTVANLLVNQLGHEDVRDRIARDFPPAGRYDEHQRPYDRENHESGLYGPVTLSGAATAVSAHHASLDGTWTLEVHPYRGASYAIPAAVPGNVELDLLRAGRIADPEIGTNVRALRAREADAYVYSRTFATPRHAAGERVSLRFEGIDTFAEVFVNGRKVGDAANMHLAHAFDVTDVLKPGGANALEVRIRPALLEGAKHSLEALGVYGDGAEDGETLRKALHSWGWDILPRLVSAGLWRSVWLDVVPEHRLSDVFWMTVEADRRRAVLQVCFRAEVPFDALDATHARLVLSRDGRTAYEHVEPLRHFRNRFRVEVENPALWWPRGSGEAALYDARIELVAPDGRLLAADVRRIGLRTVELVRRDVTADDPGEFLFRVNGRRVYIRGANHVPCDALHSRDAARYDSLIALVTDLNCNLLRCWGGGTYEDTAFYERCDREGILVWQDFMTGCSIFPQDDAYAAATAEEVRQVVLKLRNHPSLALWSGNNENDQSPLWKFGRLAAKVDPNRDRNSRRTIPEVLYANDPTRPYLPSSPYVSPAVFAGRAQMSEDHLWGARGYYKDAYYTNSPARFVSEMGYHGCPSRASLERMMTPACVYPWLGEGFDWNAEWKCKGTSPHQGHRLDARNGLMLKQTKILFGETSRDLDTFIRQSQTVQAEAMKTFVELFRSRKYRGSNGLVWWNVRDGWPIVSDAVVDYYGGRKLAYWTIRNAQRDQVVVIRDDHAVVAVNDAPCAVRGSVRVSDAASGRILFARSGFEIPADGVLDLGTVAWQGQGVLLIEATLGGRAYSNHFLYGEPPFEFARIRELLPYEREMSAPGW